MKAYDVSPSSLKPLLNSYWSDGGWLRPPATLPDDTRKAAEQSGVMFPTLRTLSHDDLVRAVIEAVASVSPKSVSSAFVGSLGSRRLDLRSALGSFAVGRHLTPHTFQPDTSKRCKICGAHSTEKMDLNVLSFERFKWGGVRRNSLSYVLFDLEQFQLAPGIPASDHAIALLGEALEVLRTAEPSTTVPKAVRLLRGLPGNTAERRVLLEILGSCGILVTNGHPSFIDEFVPDAERTLPAGHFADIAYPACWWVARNGLDARAISTFLPEN